MKNYSIVVLFLLCTLASTSSFADNPTFEIDFAKLSSSWGMADFNTSAIQLRAASAVDPNIDIEGMLAFGLSDDKYEVFDPTFGTVSITLKLANMLGLFAKAHSDPSAGYELYGRIGLVLINYDADFYVSSLGSASQSYDGSGLAFGVGVSFSAGGNGSLVLEYSKLPNVDMEGTDIESSVLSLGFQVPL